MFFPIVLDLTTFDFTLVLVFKFDHAANNQAVSEDGQREFKEFLTKTNG